MHNNDRQSLSLRRGFQTVEKVILASLSREVAFAKQMTDEVVAERDDAAADRR